MRLQVASPRPRPSRLGVSLRQQPEDPLAVRARALRVRCRRPRGASRRRRASPVTPDQRRRPGRGELHGVAIRFCSTIRHCVASPCTTGRSRATTSTPERRVRGRLELGHDLLEVDLPELRVAADRRKRQHVQRSGNPSAWCSRAHAGSASQIHPEVLELLLQHAEREPDRGQRARGGRGPPARRRSPAGRWSGGARHGSGSRSATVSSSSRVRRRSSSRSTTRRPIIPAAGPAVADAPGARRRRRTASR